MELLLYLITLLISSIPALFLSAPPVEDALSTMGFAAFLAGYDWRVFLAEDGYFYKYGQALWYIPAYFLIKNPVIRYKLLLVVNSALDAFIPVLVYRISKRLSQKGILKVSEAESFMISLVTGMMPSILLYDKYTWSEPVLMLMPWVIMYLFLRLAECGNRPEKVRLYSAALAWAAAYAFMSHQRGIVIVIASTMTVIIYRLVTGKRLVSPAVYGANLVLALGVDRALNYWVRQVVYLGVKPKYNTLASFLRPEIYRKLFSLKGQQTVFRTFMGWMFNTSVSGLCFTLLGLICMLVIVVRAFRKKKNVDEAIFVFSLQGALAFMGAMSLGMLFFFETLYGYWEGTDVARCDHLVFGRYIESSLPILMFAGLNVLNEKTFAGRDVDRKGLWRYEGILSLAITLVLSIILVIYYSFNLAPAMEEVDSYVHSVMSMNIAFDMTGVTLTRDVIRNLPVALTVAGVVAVGVFACIFCVCYFIRKANSKGCTASKSNLREFIHKKMFIALSIMILGIFVYIYLRSFIDIIYRVDSNALTKYAQYYLNNG